MSAKRPVKAVAKTNPASKKTAALQRHFTYKNREISWLSFNERVLQEAADHNVPLLERIKFLAIFSSNLDEFFRVRVATNRRLLKFQHKQKVKEALETEKLLQDIQKIVIRQQDKFAAIYEEIQEEMAMEKIFIIDESELNSEQSLAVIDFFRREVISNLFPVILDHLREFPFVKDNVIYLAIKMTRKSGAVRHKYALIELPTEVLGRFFILPKTDDKTYIILLDDVIRHSLAMIFSNLDFEKFTAHTIKVTRDAELEMENDEQENLVEAMRKSLKERHKGAPVRFIYDSEIPDDLLQFIVKKLKISKENMIPGGRYHNFKDFFDFPPVGGSGTRYATITQIHNPDFEASSSMFDVIAKSDVMLQHPYQPFDYVIRFLREAAIDPSVYAIKITLYRVAKHSNVVNALINAVKNGKQVTVVIELQARFDEESNLYWTSKLQEAGATVIFGVPTHKVHAKICLVFRRENNKTVHYAHLSTGNYNGKTAKLYSDFGLFTSDTRITADLIKVFSFINNFPRINYSFKHLLVSPLYLKKEYLRLIDREIKNSKAGGEAYIFAKMNSLVDIDIINKLYEASNNGVKVRLIVRGICCLRTGIKGQSENIEIISIVDKFLEHARVYIFGNNGNPLVYSGSADWMTRNLERRIEVIFPILDERIKHEFIRIMEIQWADNVKARIIDSKQINEYRQFKLPAVRAQVETYSYLLARSSRH